MASLQWAAQGSLLYLPFGFSDTGNGYQLLLLIKSAPPSCIHFHG